MQNGAIYVDLEFLREAHINVSGGWGLRVGDDLTSRGRRDKGDLED